MDIVVVYLTLGAMRNPFGRSVTIGIALFIVICGTSWILYSQEYEKNKAERFALADQSIRCAAMYQLSFPEKQNPTADYETKAFWVRGQLGLAVLLSSNDHVTENRFNLATDEILKEIEVMKTQPLYDQRLRAYMEKSIGDCKNLMADYVVKNGLPPPLSAAK